MVLRNANTFRQYLKVYYLSGIHPREPKNSLYIFQIKPYQVDLRAAIRVAFVYRELGINRMMIIKETPASTTISNPMQKIFQSLSSDEKNVLRKEMLQLTNDDCKSVIITMQNEGMLQIFGACSIKDSRGSDAYHRRSSSEENALYVESNVQCHIKLRPY